MFRPKSPTASPNAWAQRTARAGPSKVAQQAVTGRVDVAAPVAFDLPAGELVMAREQIGPAGIAEFGQPLGGPTMSVNRTVERMRSRLGR
jgi:hypothetical protein